MKTQREHLKALVLQAMISFLEDDVYGSPDWVPAFAPDGTRPCYAGHDAAWDAEDGAEFRLREYAVSQN